MALPLGKCVLIGGAGGGGTGSIEGIDGTRDGGGERCFVRFSFHGSVVDSFWVDDMCFEYFVSLK